MTDFLKIAKSIVVHFAHICAYGVETVKFRDSKHFNNYECFDKSLTNFNQTILSLTRRSVQHCTLHCQWHPAIFHWLMLKILE